MANLLDYLDWRGDLTMAQAPFNEVDNLILAELSYVDFRGILPPPGQGRPVPLETAAQAFFSRYPEGEKIDLGVLIPDQIPEMLERMAASRRFGGMKLGCFLDQVDAAQGEQFAALAAETGDGAVYLSFRGTDDTLAGWREDLEMACMPEVPAQKKALAYIETAARQYARRKLRLGGHSKGGNLAVYAAVFCPAAIQRRILDVWSTRTFWNFPSTGGWRTGSTPSCPSPRWWGCCWSTRRTTPWWTATSWAFCSTTAFPGRCWGAGS